MTKNLDGEGLRAIIENYDLFFIDLWGVVHNGIKLHEEAIDVLDKISKGNKNYILLLSFSLLLSMIKIDINNASYDEVLSLPLSEEKNNNIWLYINSSGEINSIYDLLNINLLTAQDVHVLKKYIKIIKKELIFFILGHKTSLNLRKKNKP